MVVLYRSGSNPGSNHKPSAGWVSFDAMAPIPLGCSPRSTSVYTALTLEAAEDWVEYRLDCGLDADIYSVEIPDDHVLYAHDIRFYEQARYIKELNPDTDPMIIFQKVVSYWENRVQVISGLSLVEDPTFFEVLIPFDIANKAIWELVKKVNEEDYYSEDDYLVYDFG